LLQHAEKPGVELVEVEYWSKKNGLCCGAGGAQMWLEEQNKDRVNAKRTLQFLDIGAKTIASACPFCMTTISEGIKAHSREEDVKNPAAGRCGRARRLSSEPVRTRINPSLQSTRSSFAPLSRGARSALVRRSRPSRLQL
jgi:hypothetical protein